MVLAVDVVAALVVPMLFIVVLAMKGWYGMG